MTKKGSSCSELLSVRLKDLSVDHFCNIPHVQHGVYCLLSVRVLLLRGACDELEAPSVEFAGSKQETFLKNGVGAFPKSRGNQSRLLRQRQATKRFLVGKGFD